MKMEATGSFETLVMIYQATWSHIPENSNLHSHRHENLPFPIFLRNQNIHSRANNSSPLARVMLQHPSNPISLRSILILSSHLRLGLLKWPIPRAFFLAGRAGTAFRNLFEGTTFQKSKNKINKSSVSKFKEFSKLAHYLRPSR
jgi:hypothetical protein